MSIVYLAKLRQRVLTLKHQTAARRAKEEKLRAEAEVTVAEEVETALQENESDYLLESDAGLKCSAMKEYVKCFGRARQGLQLVFVRPTFEYDGICSSGDPKCYILATLDSH